MVEHLPRGPEFEPILDTPAELPAPHGLCLVCGDWIDDEDADSLSVAVTDRAGARMTAVAHRACLASVAHESVRPRFAGS